MATRPPSSAQQQPLDGACQLLLCLPPPLLELIVTKLDDVLDMASAVQTCRAIHAAVPWRVGTRV